jgi:4-amino-4-deoxy-L-arabinose transferase-like glycosyltransferase
MSGIVLGVAELSKTTLLIFYPLWPIIWLVFRWDSLRKMRFAEWLRELAMLLLRMAVGVYVIGAGYGFDGCLTPLRELKFVSAAVGIPKGEAEVPLTGGNRFAGTWIGALPILLPKDYVLGIDLQRLDFERYQQPSYLRGKFSSRGWWYYYIYALAIKVPLGTWLLLALAATTRSVVPCAGARRGEFLLLCPPLIILIFVSSQTGFSEHMRYVLPVFPFIYVWTGRIAVAFLRPNRVRLMLTVALLLWATISSLFVYPHSLSYFNELVGGPSRGASHLIHSNIDWGQDLFLLKAWLDANPQNEPIKLIYFGYFDPKFAGVDYVLPENISNSQGKIESQMELPRGVYAVSVNFVMGYPSHAYTGDGAKVRLVQGQVAVFQGITPVGKAGHSIYIYDLR